MGSVPSYSQKDGEYFYGAADPRRPGSGAVAQKQRKIMKKLLVIFFLNFLIVSSSLFARTQTTLDYQDRIHAESSENLWLYLKNICKLKQATRS